MRIVSILSTALLFLSACSTTESPYVSVAEESETSQCSEFRSYHWQAWIEKDDTAKLHLEGNIDFPSPGYSISARLGPMDRARPPGLRIILTVNKPQQPTIQVITPTPVTFSFDALTSVFREVIIVCGDSTLATIPNVTERHAKQGN